MKSEDIILTAFESIGFQHQKPVYDDLLNELNILRPTTDISEGQSILIAKQFGDWLSKYAKDRFNIALTIDYDTKGDFGDFYMFHPSLTLENIHSNQRDLDAAHVHKLKFDISNLEHIGKCIVFDKGLVYFTEYFKDLESTLVFPGYCLMETRMTNEMIAGALCHEFGHIFVYFGYIKEVINCNRTVAETYDRFTKENSAVERLKFIKDLAHKERLEFESMESLAEAKSPEEAAQVVIVSYAEKFRKDNGLVSFSENALEQLVDRAAVRLGGAKGLVAYLAYFRKGQKQAYRMSTYACWIMSVAFVITGNYLIGFVLTLQNHINMITAMMPFTMALMNYKDVTHESLIERTKVVKNELLAGLKDNTLKPEYVKKMLNQFNYVESVLNSKEYKLSLLEMKGFLMSYFSGNYRQVKFQKQFEELSNNKLFAKAASITHS